MKLHKPLALTLLLSLLGLPLLSQADGDWKRGRVYYRMVCTVCHVEKSGASISPSVKTKAEWNAYIAADKHAKGKDSLKYYVSKPYRDSIKATNKAAEKYADVPDADLLADVQAFVNYGAKDSDNPARCQ